MKNIFVLTIILAIGLLVVTGIKADAVVESNPVIKDNIVCTAYCVEKTIKVCAVDYPEACTNVKATFCNQVVKKSCQLKFSSFL